MSKKILITQSNYIPWRGYFDAIRVADVLVLYDEVQYTRRDWRNRNRILLQQKPHWLSIPVAVKGKFLQTIEEVQVSDQNWRKTHWEVLRHAYNKAPYWQEISELLMPLYLHSTETTLSQINFHFIRTILQYLHINTPIIWSNSIPKHTADASLRLLEICKFLQADTYLSGPAAKAYLHTSAFAQQNVRVAYFNYTNYPSYPQIGSTFFVPQLSVLDLLFNEGKNAVRYLKSYPEVSNIPFYEFV
ncbi:MAG: WbqC family protein [Chitinophagales bacterium]|nr:WbqC family protein [Bacteroidota bacterium]MCB9042543.1 WbqC family protein [Chitinophagales bacterium]